MPTIDQLGPLGTRTRLVPRWVRAALLAVVAALFALSVALLALSVSVPEREGWAVPAAAIAETSGTACLVLLVLFFVERGQDVPRVEALSDRFFVDDLPRAFEKMAYVEPRHVPWHRGWTRSPRLASRVEIEVSHARGSYRAGYVLRVDGLAVALEVELNVQRMNVVYLIGARPGDDPAAAFGALADTFEGARNADYRLGVPRDASEDEAVLRQHLDWGACMQQALHRALGEGFLYDPVMRQFMAQDLAIMTRSLLREGRLAGVIARSAAA